MGKVAEFVDGMNPQVQAKKIDTYISFLLDESGSMAGVKADTIKAFNEYVDKLKGSNNIAFTLTKFSTSPTIVYNADDVNLVSLSDDTYMPDGGTSLYDALGSTVASLQKAVKDKTAKFLVVVLTDGDENSSKEFTHDSIIQLIKAREAEGNWTFVYLSSDLNAWKTAHNLGFAAGNTAVYASTNIVQTMGALSGSTLSYVSSKSAATASFCGDNAADYHAAGAEVGANEDGMKLPEPPKNKTAYAS